jgi:hypothetical protein
MDFEVVVDKLPEYSEACNHADAGPTAEDALRIAIEAAGRTENAVAAAALLVEAAKLDANAPELRAKLLALLIACKLDARTTGFGPMVDKMVEPAVTSLTASIGSEHTPRLVAELARCVERGATRSE